MSSVAARRAVLSPSAAMWDFFRRNRRAINWGIGIICVPPATAIVQGTLMLKEYRTNHGDAPRPAMPASGVVVVADDPTAAQSAGDEVDTAQSPLNQPLHTNVASVGNDLPPLRILVVGDSLAAGVGLSKSGTPVLPESIARALSQASGGRVVYWTCVGTPGFSASQIIQDINDMTPHKDPSMGRLERLLKEWQQKRRIFIKRRQERERQELEALLAEEAKNAKEQEAISKRRNAFKQWWDRIKSAPTITPDEIKTTTEDVVKTWWSSVTRRVREDWTDIKELSTADPTTLPTDDDESNLENSSKKNEENAAVGEELLLLPTSTTVFGMSRRSSLNPRAAAQFDVAIVLTGLNDVKEAFMPHMMRGRNSSVDEESTFMLGGFGDKLKGVLEALRDKMKDGMGDLDEQERKQKELRKKQLEEQAKYQSMELDYSSTVGSSCLPKVSYQPAEASADKKIGQGDREGEQAISLTSTGNARRPPLVVIPALPIAPLELFQTAPLCWFLRPIFRFMEHQKRDLQERFPNVVLFVDQPTKDDWTDIEDGRGPLWDALSRERILYQLTDVAQQTRERIQHLMDQHYGKEEQEEDKSSHWTTDQEEQQRMEIDARYGRKRGSSFIAADKIHPNDKGYEIWGQHIAAAIVKRWELKQEI